MFVRHSLYIHFEQSNVCLKDFVSVFITRVVGLYLNFGILWDDEIKYISLSEFNKQNLFIISCLSDFVSCSASLLFTKWGYISQV